MRKRSGGGMGAESPPIGGLLGFSLGARSCGLYGI